MGSAASTCPHPPSLLRVRRTPISVLGESLVRAAPALRSEAAEDEVELRARGKEKFGAIGERALRMGTTRLAASESQLSRLGGPRDEAEDCDSRRLIVASEA